MNNFYNHFKLVNEAFSQWEYKLPEDKEQQLFDFYMLVGLQSPNDTKLNTAYKDALESITRSLRVNLKKAILWSVCAEFRHIYSRNNAQQLRAYFKSQTPEWFEFFKEYTKNYRLSEDSFSDLYKDRNRKGSNNRYIESRKNYYNSYQAVNKAINTTGFDVEGFMQLCKDAFINVDWAGSYGGKPWSMIADGWLMLDDADKLNNKIIAIDHAYDLQHNTDTVFNKLQTYYKASSGFKWVKRALDKKRDLKDVYEIYDDISAGLKPFAAAVIKDTTGNDLEMWFRKKRSNSMDNISHKLKKPYGPPSKKPSAESDHSMENKVTLPDNYFVGLFYASLAPQALETYISILKEYFSLIKNGEINQNVKIRNMRLLKIPPFFKNVTVNGNFDCSSNHLTTLENAPIKVKGSFDCRYNPLKNVKHIPIVNGQIQAPPFILDDEINREMKKTHEKTLDKEEEMIGSYKKAPSFSPSPRSDTYFTLKRIREIYNKFSDHLPSGYKWPAYVDEADDESKSLTWIDFIKGTKYRVVYNIDITTNEASIDWFIFGDSPNNLIHHREDGPAIVFINANGLAINSVEYWSYGTKTSESDVENDYDEGERRFFTQDKINEIIENYENWLPPLYVLQDAVMKIYEKDRSIHWEYAGDKHNESSPNVNASPNMVTGYTVRVVWKPSDITYFRKMSSGVYYPHDEYGPAKYILYPGGKVFEEYYLNGNKLTQSEWESQLRTMSEQI